MTSEPAATVAASEFGRVDGAGNVYVVTSTGERLVGQWLSGDPEKGLAFYRSRFAGLEVEVDLLEQRIKAGAVPLASAAKAVRKVRRTVEEAQAVGDLDALLRRLDALMPMVEERQAAKAAETRAAKVALVAEAERLAESTDWRRGSARLREILDEWKALPRVDRATDDELWRRYAAARTAYEGRRKAHFAKLHEQRVAAQSAKEALIVQAEALADSTDWAATSRAYRDLMGRWKAAGAAPREVEEELWRRFRAAQDRFFSARDAANAKTEVEYAANSAAKRQILADAERLLPVRDPKAARTALRGLAAKWDAVGKVSRADLKPLEDRFGEIEQMIRGAEDDRRPKNPEAYARAAATVAQLEESIAALRSDLAKADEADNESGAKDLREAIAARESWLTQARKSLADLS